VSVLHIVAYIYIYQCGLYQKAGTCTVILAYIYMVWGEGAGIMEKV